MFLKVDHTSKTFPARNGDGAGAGGGRFCVFENVSLHVEQGEFVTIIGHSGCGKSTLLNIIAGFDQPDTGGVVLDGREVRDPGLDRMVVFQSFALMPWLTAFDNVSLAVRAAYPGWSRAEIRAHTHKYLDLMGLRGAGGKLPTFLSGGMRQRVGLARAFAVAPKVLLLDEPFAQIDALTRGVIQEELIRMWSATGNSVLMVTHDVDEAILLSDRILLMSNSPHARIERSVTIDLPRPRRREVVIDQPEYVRLRSEVLHFLLEHASHGAPAAGGEADGPGTEAGPEPGSGPAPESGSEPVARVRAAS